MRRHPGRCPATQSVDLIEENGGSAIARGLRFAKIPRFGNQEVGHRAPLTRLPTW
jgi:hypothetical protein